VDYKWQLTLLSDSLRGEHKESTIETIRIRLTVEELKILNRIAQGSNKSVSGVIKMWIHALDHNSFAKELFGEAKDARD